MHVDTAQIWILVSQVQLRIQDSKLALVHLVDFIIIYSYVVSLTTGGFYLSATLKSGLAVSLALKHGESCEKTLCESGKSQHPIQHILLLFSVATTGSVWALKVVVTAAEHLADPLWTDTVQKN